MAGNRRSKIQAPLRSYAVRTLSERLPHLAASAIADRLSYGSFVSLEHKILYVETPKAACTTIKHFLRTLCHAPPLQYPIGSLRETRRDMFIHVRANVPLPSLLDLDDDTQRHVLAAPDFLRLAIVRNPYTRLTSAWRNKIMVCEPGYEYVYRKVMGDIPPLRQKKLLTFEQFLQFVEQETSLSTCNPHWRRQVDLLLYPAISYSHIGKMERMSETAAVLQEHVGTSVPVHFDSSNRTAGRGDPLDEQAAARILALYRSDFETFGYEERSWPRDSSSRNVTTPDSEARYLDEIVERNIVISHLYEEYARLQADHRGWLHCTATQARARLSQIWHFLSCGKNHI